MNVVVVNGVALSDALKDVLRTFCASVCERGNDLHLACRTRLDAEAVVDWLMTCQARAKAPDRMELHLDLHGEPETLVLDWRAMREKREAQHEASGLAISRPLGMTFDQLLLQNGKEGQ